MMYELPRTNHSNGNYQLMVNLVLSMPSPLSSLLDYFEVNPKLISNENISVMCS